LMLATVAKFSSRVAGPNHSHLAPFMDYSMLDTCSRCYTRIAPWLTSSACVAHGLLRAQHFSASHRSQITPRSILGLPHRSRIAPFSAFPALCCLSGSLRCSALHALLAPGSDFSSPDSRVSHRSRIASRSILGLPRRARIAPVSTLPALRCPRIPPSASLSARTRHELLRARHLAFRIVPGLLRARCFPPCVARGSLRSQRLTLTALLRRLFARPLVPAPFLEFPLRFLLLSVLGVPCFPRIAPRFTLSA